MKHMLITLAIFLGIALAAAACGSDTGDEITEPGPAAQGEQGDAGDSADSEATAPGERVETLWVGPQLVECVGAFPQMCMQVKYAQDGQAEYFYDSIEGFEHVAGTSYVLTVGVSDVEDPPADASSLRYRLIEIVESTVQQPDAGIEGKTWMLLGFRDGDLFDPVPQGIEVTAMVDGSQINGSSGCNTYGGSFSATDDGVQVGPLMGTRKACEADRMQVEQRFLSTLETVESVEITFDERLLLKPASGPMLVFVES